jgi:hypothetical protein
VSATALELLADAPFFEGFDPEELAALARRARTVELAAGQPLFAEGEPATAFYLLASGAVEVAFAGPGGRREADHTVTTPATRSAGRRSSSPGLEHLPERPGHIVIMNHLQNHPDNLLPNNFILTLDTHFVASMVLFERYGEAPIRVVRKSRPDEHGHQRFYDRLGYVYTWSGRMSAEAGTWSSARKGRRPRPRRRRCASARAPSGWPPTSAPSRCWCRWRWCSGRSGSRRWSPTPPTTPPAGVPQPPAAAAVPPLGPGGRRAGRLRLAARPRRPKPGGTPPLASSSQRRSNACQRRSSGEPEWLTGNRITSCRPPRWAAMASTVGAGTTSSARPTPTRVGQRRHRQQVGHPGQGLGHQGQAAGEAGPLQHRPGHRRAEQLAAHLDGPQVVADRAPQGVPLRRLDAGQDPAEPRRRRQRPRDRPQPRTSTPTTCRPARAQRQAGRLRPP